MKFIFEIDNRCSIKRISTDSALRQFSISAMGELGDIASLSPSEQPVRGLKMESSAYSISKATVADAKDVVDYCNKVR